MYIKTPGEGVKFTGNQDRELKIGNREYIPLNFEFESRFEIEDSSLGVFREKISGSNDTWKLLILCTITYVGNSWK